MNRGAASTSKLEPAAVFKGPTVDELRRVIGVEGFQDLLRVFLTESRNDLDALRRALAEDREIDAAFYAHRMKGASAAIGAEAVQYLATAAEALGRVGRADIVRQLVPDLEAAVEQVRVASGPPRPSSWPGLRR